MKSSTILSLIGVAVILLVIGAALGSIAFPMTKTETTTQVTTTTQTAIHSTTETILTQTSTLSNRLYDLIFIQMGACPQEYYFAPWSVTLNNRTTIVEPPNASLPISEQSGISSTRFKNYSTIAFSVLPGTYNYNIEPQNFLPNSSGNATITNRDVTIQIGPGTVTCPSESQNSTK
jgi:hypothetical protein